MFIRDTLRLKRLDAKGWNGYWTAIFVDRVLLSVVV